MHFVFHVNIMQFSKVVRKLRMVTDIRFSASHDDQQLVVLLEEQGVPHCILCSVTYSNHRIISIQLINLYLQMCSFEM